MGSPTGKTSQSTGADRISLAVDRARSFRQARRHTVLVRLAKLVLPSLAAVALVGYGVITYSANRLKGKGFDAGNVRIDPKNLTMEAPRYEGFGKDGARYVFRAREAITDLRQSGPVRLNTIDGDITQQTGVVTKLVAVWGTYDQKKDILELYEKIDIDGSTGMKARLTRATVWPKESRVESNEPIYAETESGNIRSRRMVMNSKARQATFTEAVHVTLKPNQPAKSADPAKAAQGPAKQTQVLPGLAANSGQPIEVKSERLDVDDNDKTALFRTDVIARQGDAVLQAPELDVLYEGRAALTDPGAPAEKDGETTAKLKTIKARGGVVMTNKDDKATAETLDYDAKTERAVLKGSVVLTAVNERQVTARQADLDQKADTALLTGDVVVVQGKNTMRGQRLFVERKTGRTRLDSPAEGGAAAGRIQTVFYQANAQKADAGRPAGKPSEAAQLNPFATSFKSDPSQPIDITASTLDVADLEKKAIYRGAVVAKQGEFTVETPELTAFYTGQAGIATSGQPAPAKAPKGEAGQGAQLSKVEARQKVAVTGKDGQRAFADNADFEVKANRIIMWGSKVRVEQPVAGDATKKNIVEGPPGVRFVIDMTSGESRFEQIDAPAKPAGPAVSAAGPATDQASGAAAAAKQPEAQKPRTRAVFYPNQTKEALKKAGDAAGAKDKAAAKTGSSAWEATTSSAGDRKQ